MGHAQDAINVQIRDAHTGLSVAGAHITLISRLDTQYTIAGLDGLAKLSSTPGVAKLFITHVAYQSLIIKNPKLDETVDLSPARNDLQEVVVTGQNGPVLARQCRAASAGNQPSAH
ncbi:MAG: hypothetical protein U5L96_04970 [Owenweeksia sp.]|nr:hypothetical protein [Owenweeksia sp.]